MSAPRPARRPSGSGSSSRRWARARAGASPADAAPPALKGKRFLAGPAALTLFPVVAALHRTVPGASLLPGWGPPSAATTALLSAALVALLWSRIVPGHRRAS